jgi:hypothetical protein
MAPAALATLGALDGVRRATCKKADALKRSEVLLGLWEALAGVARESCGVWMRSRWGGQVLLELVRAERGRTNVLTPP